MSIVRRARSTRRPRNIVVPDGDPYRPTSRTSGVQNLLEMIAHRRDIEAANKPSNPPQWKFNLKNQKLGRPRDAA